MTPSRIIPVTPEPVDGTARLSMHDSRRERVVERQGGVCAYPGCGVTDGLEIDHVVCLGLGGKERDDNLQAICGPHHKQKTRLDKALIARAKRRKFKHDTPKSEWPKSGPELRGRGFGRRWSGVEEQ